MWEKLRFVASTVLSVSKIEDIVVLVVLYKVILAKFRFNIRLQHFCSYKLASKPVSGYKEYMQKREIESLQKIVNSEESRVLLDNKILFNLKCNEYGLPTVPVYAVLTPTQSEGTMNGIPIIRDGDHLLEILKNDNRRSLIFKKMAGSHGEGVMAFWISRGRVHSHSSLEQEPQRFLDSLRATKSTYILQPKVQQHDALLPIMTNGLGTLRVVTTSLDRSIKIDFICLKIPVGKNISDNINGGGTGNLLADIDLESGTIGVVLAGAKDNEYIVTEVYKHPTTRVLLKGMQLPNWPDLKELALVAASKFSGLRTIGWDIALTQNGPILIEGNWRYDIDLLQMSSQRGLRSEVLANLGMV